ncbi:MAG: flagellar biosynthesis protein FliQ [Alphaproteobacteria bacterium]|nr:flagellar biosynthesis protein FliQ [Alphaproteobacteria bacterium]NCP62507.1 flagellar biosynthesis protein FliQ [Alphaproteobacteria bacterium]NCQ66938.1 flagellar biosynthesis protein FliQ [Alphaproteobacteria bacterium]NCT07505.1 flagellar biosynthesis protein FliQ [Alphaproteobacteria bacterium]
MTPGEVLQIGQEALWIILKIGVPMMLVALGIGLLVSFVQALTQIQEMTLSFVPKIIGMFLIMVMLLPYFGSTLHSFTLQLFDKIIGVH